MRNKWKQQLFVYLLLLSLIITLGMNVNSIQNSVESVQSESANHLSNLDLSTVILPTEPPIIEPAPTPSPTPIYDDLKSKVTILSAVNEPEPKQEIVEAPKNMYEVTAYYLNVRTKPNAASAIIKVIEKGSIYEVAAELENGWLELALGGYIHGHYAEKVKSEVHILSVTDERAEESSTEERVVEMISEPEHNEVPSEPSTIVASDSGLTEEHIETIFDGTALAGQGLEEAILEIEDEYGINAYFTIAVMKLESGNGKSKIAQKKNNLFGLNAIDGDQFNKAFSFETKADSVKKFGQLLSKNYVGKGLKTIEKVAKKYCPANSKWSSLVLKIMKSDYRKL